MMPQDKSPVSDFLQKFDFWILDRIFQPLANRLPERWSALKIGMNLQLGSLVFSAGSLILLVLVLHMSIFSMLFNVFSWGLGGLFYFSINQISAMVRVGFLNPFRMMLSGVRIISIPITLYSIYLGITAISPYQEAMLFNSISNSIFVFGLYLISCQPNPPP